MYSQLPAGTVKSPRQTPSAPRVSSVAAHSGCQSPGHPSSSWRLPTRATVVSGAGGGSLTTVTAFVEAVYVIVTTSSAATVNATFEAG